MFWYRIESFLDSHQIGADLGCRLRNSGFPRHSKLDLTRNVKRPWFRQSRAARREPVVNALQRKALSSVIIPHIASGRANCACRGAFGFGAYQLPQVAMWVAVGAAPATWASLARRDGGFSALPALCTGWAQNWAHARPPCNQADHLV